MEKEKINLSIVILSYNSKTDLERLLPSIWGSEGVEFSSNDNYNYNYNYNNNGKYKAEVIIVDNGSTDSTANWLKDKVDHQFQTIFNTNSGFARGNNLGIQKARGEYLLILNPDTKLEAETLKTMLEFMEARPEVGISTCKVVLPNGKLDLACRRRFPNPWNSFKRLFLQNNQNYNYTDYDQNTEMEIDSCMGAFMLIRRQVLEVVNNPQNLHLPHPAKIAAERTGQGISGFDEAFFMYGEDIDLCWQCKEAGYKVWYYPKTFITHYKGSASAKTPFRALKWFYDAMWIFYKKHYAGKYPFFFNWLVFGGIYGRFLVLTAINFFQTKPRVSKQA